MNAEFKTIGQLIRYLIDEMVKSHKEPYEVVSDNRQLISECTHLYRLSHLEAEILMQGSYHYCVDAKDVKEELLFDYCVVKLKEFLISRSISSYKKFMMQE